MYQNITKTETDIKKEITSYLRNRGYTVHRMNSGKVKVKNGWLELCEKGTPDLLVLGKDKFIMWIETKKPGEKASQDQLKKIDYYITLGHNAIIADCLQDVIDFMPV